MIMDCHTHAAPLRGNELLEELERVGVTHAIVMVIPSAMTLTEDGDYTLHRNETALERLADDNRQLGIWCRHVGPTLLPFAWLDHRMKCVTSLFEDLVARYHFRGLKIHQVFNGPADHRYFELVGKAVELDVPIMIHTGFRAPAHAQNIGLLAARFPEGKFLCAHLLEEWNLNTRADYRRLADNHDNVSFECSYVRHPRRLGEFVRDIGAHRILFGSDFPFGARDIAWDLTKVRWAGIGDAAKEKILWRNAAALFGLSERV